MKRHRGATTLVELLIVLIVLAILTLTTVQLRLDPLASAARRQMAVVVDARRRAVIEGHGSCVAPEVSSVSIRFPARGLAFTPDGLPRTCDGGGVGNTTILLEHRGRQAAVIVSSLGRVRWELR